MHTPERPGISDDDWARLLAPHDRERDRALRRAADLTTLDGVAAIWYHTAAGALPAKLAIQPGIADDLPSLLSTLATEIAWTGAPAIPAVTPGRQPERAVGVWARVWQVRDQADLRLELRWDARGQFHGSAVLRTPNGETRELKTQNDLVRLLNRVAVHPETSESPHGLILAGNRALEAGDYQGARACYESAIRDLPRHLEAHRNLALALAHMNEWESATVAMQQARELAPSDIALEQEYLALETDAGIIAAQNGDLERAARHFLRILANWPEEPTSLVNLGNIRAREGRTPEARAIYQRFLRLHPQHAAAEQIRLALAALDEPRDMTEG